MILRTLLTIALLFLLTACQKASLLESLDEPQANEIVSVLLRHNIAAEKRGMGKGSFTVDVAPSDLPQAIDLVQEYGLPTPSATQISQAFPADAMVSTPLGERARLYSAIEQRLEESIAAMHGVRKAHVDVSYDLRTTTSLSRDQVPEGMRLAAVVVHEPGVDEQVLLQSVKRFLRNTFSNVEYDNISVILSPAKPARVLATTPQSVSSSVETPSLAWMGLVLVGVVAAIAAVLRLVATRTSPQWARAVRTKLLPGAQRGDAVEH